MSINNSRVTRDYLPMVSRLNSSTDAGILMPLIKDEIIQEDKWSKAQDWLELYSWHDKKNKIKGLHCLEISHEVINNDIYNNKSKAINLFKEIFNYLLVDTLSANGIESIEFWWDRNDFDELPLNNDKVQLPAKVYEILTQLTHCEVPMKMKILESKPKQLSVHCGDPVFVISLFGEKWFKLYQW